MSRRGAAALVAGLAIVIAGLGVQVSGILAIDVCVTIYENGAQSGDLLSTCNTSPSNVKIPNLGTHTEGLHSGCARVLNTSSTWNDCVSSARVSALPGSQKVVFYQDINYIAVILCVDSNGTSNQSFGGGTNDVLSSFRILGGNC